jgi:hypothetical protein
MIVREAECRKVAKLLLVLRADRDAHPLVKFGKAH